MGNQKPSPTALAPKLRPIAQLRGDDEEDIRLLQEMADRARRYLQSFEWCSTVLEGWFAEGVGGVFAMFLFQILPAGSGVDEWIWIMNGDVPSIYLAFEDAPSVSQAFRTYVDGMLRWVTYARSGQIEIPEDVPPIDTPPTHDLADNLERRMRSLERILGPVFS